MKIDLKGKVILVTGAAGGIGEPIVRLLAEHGATVAIHYNQRAEGAKRLAAEVGNDSKPFHADLSQPRNGTALFHEVVRTYGRFDVLVNTRSLTVMCYQKGSALPLFRTPSLPHMKRG